MEQVAKFYGWLRKSLHVNVLLGLNLIFLELQLGLRHLGADIWAGGHLGAKTFGRKTFGREMRSSALPTIIFYFFQKKFFGVKCFNFL